MQEINFFYLRQCILGPLFYFLGAPRGLWFTDHGLNPGPQQWKRRVLTTGPPGNSPLVLFIITACSLALPWPTQKWLYLWWWIFLQEKPTLLYSHWKSIFILKMERTSSATILSLQTIHFRGLVYIFICIFHTYLCHKAYMEPQGSSTHL